MKRKQHNDPIQKALEIEKIPGKISRELAEISIDANGVLFDSSFYEEVQRLSTIWGKRAGSYTKMAVFIPVGWITFFSAFGFPDKDISILGIGNHRFCLFHSGISIWMIRKLYETHPARTSNTGITNDKIVGKILAVIGASAAFGVGCHLLVDTFQPKSVIFPFFGSLINGTIVDDNIWLLGNAIWCFKMSKDMFVLALGDDLDLAKEYVENKFIKSLGRK